MDHHIAVAGANDGDVIYTLGEAREKVRDLDAALTVSFECALHAEQLRLARDELILRLAETRRALLAVQFVEQWFGIEGLQVAGAASKEKEDHGFRRAVVMWFLCSQ